MVTKQHISFNYNSIGVKIYGFGLVNSYRSPTLIMEIHNFDSLNTISFDLTRINIIIEGDTLSPYIKSESIIKLAPNRREKFRLSYNYSFRTKTEHGFFQKKLPKIIFLKINYNIILSLKHFSFIISYIFVKCFRS